jgi:predicted anti-sigma-YlaC factor YlaD
MNCDEYQETLSAFLDGNSREEDAAAAFGHMAGCEECRAFLRSAIDLQHGLRAMSLPEPSATIDRRIRQIPSREKARAESWAVRLAGLLRRRFTIPVPALAGGIGLLFIALGFSFWLLTRTETVPEQKVIYVVSAPAVEVYGVRAPSPDIQH